MIRSRIKSWKQRKNPQRNSPPTISSREQVDRRISFEMQAFYWIIFGFIMAAAIITGGTQSIFIAIIASIVTAILFEEGYI